MLGVTDGETAAVGETVAVGATVGVMVGLTVGFMVGLTVGRPVGFLWGFLWGFFVGFLWGFGAGLWVGCVECVGLADAAAAGPTVAALASDCGPERAMTKAAATAAADSPASVIRRRFIAG